MDEKTIKIGDAVMYRNAEDHPIWKDYRGVVVGIQPHGHRGYVVVEWNGVDHQIFEQVENLEVVQR